MRNEVWFREPSATWDDGITFLVNYNFSGHHKVTMGIKQEILMVALRAK